MASWYEVREEQDEAFRAAEAWATRASYDDDLYLEREMQMLGTCQSCGHYTVAEACERCGGYVG